MARAQGVTIMPSRMMNWGLVNRIDRYVHGKRTDTDRGGANRPHAFKIFRIGLDACAVCKKTRSEHK